MVVIDKLDIFWGQEGLIDQLSVVGAQSQVLKPVKSVLLPNEQHVFNSYSEFTIFVVTWFIGNDHSVLEVGFVILGDTDRSLMNS